MSGARRRAMSAIVVVGAFTARPGKEAEAAEAFRAAALIAELL